MWSRLWKWKRLPDVSFFFISWWHFGIWLVCDNGRDMTAAILTSYIVQKMGAHTHWQRRNIRMALLKSAGFFCSRCCFSPPSTVPFNFDARRDLQATKQTGSILFSLHKQRWNKIFAIVHSFDRLMKQNKPGQFFFTAEMKLDLSDRSLVWPIDETRYCE